MTKRLMTHFLIYVSRSVARVCFWCGCGGGMAVQVRAGGEISETRKLLAYTPPHVCAMETAPAGCADPVVCMHVLTLSHASLHVRLCLFCVPACNRSPTRSSLVCGCARSRG